MEDEEGIKNYFAAFHLHDTFPAAVVVDDFGDLFEERYVFCLSCKKCIEIFCSKEVFLSLIYRLNY